MRDHLKPGDVFVDVGANIGYYSLLAARAVGKDGSVIAFEPSPAVGRQLAANIERNGLGDRVTVHSVAAGAVPGTANIFLAGRDNIGQTSTRPGPGFTAEGEVDVRRVDDCVPVTAYPKVTFLKIDTEGDELAAAEGARALMSAMPRGAMVLVEVDEPRMAQRDTTPRALFDLMTAHGFRAFSIKNDYDVASYVRRDPAPLDPVTGVVARGDVVFVKDE
jgi:FkbM family methyltransferase